MGLRSAHVKPFASSVSVSTSSLHCVQYTILLGYPARVRRPGWAGGGALCFLLNVISSALGWVAGASLCLLLRVKSSALSLPPLLLQRGVDSVHSRCS